MGLNMFDKNRYYLSYYGEVLQLTAAIYNKQVLRKRQVETEKNKKSDIHVNAKLKII